MLQLTIQASIRVPSPPRRSAEDDQSVGGQRRSSPRRSSPENGSLAALVLILTILALTFDTTLARQWGSQRSWPTRRSHHFIGSPTTLEHTWGRNLLLQERNRALTARTSARRRISDLRGGAADAEDDEEEEEEEDEEEEADEDDAGGENETDVEEEEGDQSEYDDESDNEETVAASEEADDEEDVAVTKTKPKRTQAGRAASVSVVYDEPIVASPFLNLYVSIGVMFLAKKVDLFSPTMVRIARFAFVAYLAILQAFVLYVRIQAKLANDRTVITLTNPLSSVLQSQLLGGGNGDSSGGGGGAAAGMMKNLASSFLSSTSTVVEYDLKQANSMQSGLIFNMALNWFLHFKMEQVQPLLIQSMTGILNLLYSPLFQVYVLGRNLERPFPNPNLKKPPASEANEEDDRSTSETQEADVSSPSSQSAIEAAEKDDDDEDEEEVQEEDDDVDAGEEEESDDDEVESPEADGNDSARASDAKGGSDEGQPGVADEADAKEGDDDNGDDSTSDGSSDGE